MHEIIAALLDAQPTRADLRATFADDQRGPLLTAALIEEPQEHLFDQLTNLPSGTGPGERRWLAAATAIDSPTIDEAIDARLNDDRALATIDALIRADVDWYHPRFIDLLDDDEARFGAAWLLVQSAPDELDEALAEIDDLDHLIEILRTISLVGDDHWYPTLLGLRIDLTPEFSARQTDALDAALATLEPQRYARALLQGDVLSNWIGDDRLVADFLSRRGTSAWVDASALFRETRDREAFDLSAYFAVTAVLTEPFDDLDDELLDPLNPSMWINEMPQRVAFQLAISDDDQLSAHLVASTLHQALVERDIQPPALPGLPFSGPAPSAEIFAQSLQLLRSYSTENHQHKVALIRSLTDLVTLVRQGVYSLDQVLPILDEFAPRHDAARRAQALLSEEAPLGSLTDWGCRGIHFAHWQTLASQQSALNTLARGWIDGLPERSPLYATLFQAATQRKS